jgi:hypothetical protein
MIRNIKKLKIIPNNHLLLNQNWNFISNKLKIFHNENSEINFYEWLDKEFKEKKITGKWTGFLHNVISYPEDYPKKYNNKILPLSKLIKDFYFLDKLQDCCKILVFTDQVKKYLIKETGFQKIETIKHPAPDYLFQKVWSGNFKRIIHVGQQLRKYHSFLELKTKENKIILNPFMCKNDILEMKMYSGKTVEIIDNLKLSEYIGILQDSVVFLDLYDVSACNTIIECMILGVPILVNRLDGCVEYLGENYPLYFNNLKEAEEKISNLEIILQANKYLHSINKDQYKINYFLNKFYNNINVKNKL